MCISKTTFNCFQKKGKVNFTLVSDCSILIENLFLFFLRVFGLPDHYTDVGNISVTKRRQMIGRAWSVPVVTKILNILTDLFAMKEGFEDGDKEVTK